MGFYDGWLFPRVLDLVMQQGGICSAKAIEFYRFLLWQPEHFGSSERFRTVVS